VTGLGNALTPTGSRNQPGLKILPKFSPDSRASSQRWTIRRSATWENADDAASMTHYSLHMNHRILVVASRFHCGSGNRFDCSGLASLSAGSAARPRPQGTAPPAMKHLFLILFLGVAMCLRVLGAGDATNRFLAELPAPRLLPGQDAFAFTLYGCPDNLAQLKEVVAVMRGKHLGNGFDPGPAAVASSRPLLEHLATVGWPVILYPPDGGRMQVKGGSSVLNNADEEALRVLDRAGVFNAIQLGEWGYHFHRLTGDEGWWKAVLGTDFEARAKEFMIPAAQRGYDPLPKSRRECYDQLRDYFLWHRQTKGGRLISVTGHSHYEAYAAEWGASVVGLEVGENIGFTQSKFAFARGASRQWNLPWSVQVSPWFGNAVTTHGPLNTSGVTATGLDAGHSLSLYLRLWRHAWFSGAALVTPENSSAIFFEEFKAPWKLTEHGEAAAKAFEFMRSHDRGTPYTPLLVVLDHLAGYAPFHNLTWGILPRTQGDQEIFDLLERQLYFTAKRLAVPGNPPNPEAGYLHPTPHGELCDVMLSTVPGAIMRRYPVILLAGDVEFSRFFVHELATAAEGGSRILLHPRHVEALGLDRFARLKQAGAVEVLEAWENPDTKRPAAISRERLRQVERDTLPIAVTGDPIQYQINRNKTGWVIELINNDGVVKEGRKPAVIHPQVIARVTLTPRFAWKQATEWETGSPLPNGEVVQLEIPSGESRFVEFLVVP
jgi:hypothetical protein